MKKHRNYVAVVITIIALFGSLSVNAQTYSEEEKAVWQVVEDMYTNWEAGDVDAIFSNVHKEYLGWNNSRPMPITYTKWVTSHKDNNDMLTKRDFDIELARILVHDNVAVVHYYYSISYLYNDGDESHKVTSSGKWVEFFIKENGKWMLIGDFTSVDSKK
jgi:Domain of unknown function (DUF4440)